VRFREGWSIAYQAGIELQVGVLKVLNKRLVFCRLQTLLLGLCFSF